MQTMYSDKDSAIPDVEISGIHEPVENVIDSNTAEASVTSNPSVSELVNQNHAPDVISDKLSTNVDDAPSTDVDLNNVDPGLDTTSQAADTVINSAPVEQDDEEVALQSKDVSDVLPSATPIEANNDVTGDDLTIDAAPTEEPVDQQTFSIEDTDADKIVDNE